MSGYVNMKEGVKPGTNNIKVPGLDDPSLSQEEKDLRLAMALQQQENAAAYDAHKKRHNTNIASQNTRTARSGVNQRLANVVRKNHKDGEDEAGTTGSYGGPNGISSDAMLANELQRVGETTASTAKIIAQDNEAAKAAKRRNGRSVF
jgi:hypothetical protein